MYGTLLSVEDNGVVFIQYNIIPAKKVIKYLLSSLLSLAPPSPTIPCGWREVAEGEGGLDAGRGGRGEGGGLRESLFTFRFLV